MKRGLFSLEYLIFVTIMSAILFFGLFLLLHMANSDRVLVQERQARVLAQQLEDEIWSVHMSPGYAKRTITAIVPTGVGSIDIYGRQLEIELSQHSRTIVKQLPVAVNSSIRQEEIHNNTFILFKTPQGIVICTSEPCQ